MHVFVRVYGNVATCIHAYSSNKLSLTHNEHTPTCTHKHMLLNNTFIYDPLCTPGLVNCWVSTTVCNFRQLKDLSKWLTMQVLVDDLTRSETDDRDDQVDDITKSTQEMTVEDTPTSVTTPASTHCVGDASTVATPMQCRAAEKPCAAGSSQKKPHGTPRKQNPSVKDFLQSETANIKTSPVARRLFGTSEANSVVQKMDAIPDKCLLRTGRVSVISQTSY